MDTEIEKSTETIAEKSRIFVELKKITPTQTTPEEEETEYLLLLFDELSDDSKKKAITSLETLVNEDIKESIRQAGKELLEYQQASKLAESVIV